MQPGMTSYKSYLNTWERAGESGRGYTAETNKFSLAKWEKNVAFPRTATYWLSVALQSLRQDSFPSQGTSSKWLERQQKTKTKNSRKL